jgi:uncharacterized protein with FMN-binding domain
MGILIVFLLLDAPQRKELANLNFSAIDFNSLQDGTYIGEYQGRKFHYRDTEIKIVVAKGAVTDVKVVKGAIDKDGKPLALKEDQNIYRVIDSALQAKSLDVDVISGATVTSKAHLKAMEEALLQAQR